MVKKTTQQQILPAQPGKGVDSFPLEVRALIASVQTKAYVPSNRRNVNRQRYEVEATLWYKDPLGRVGSATIYTRDVSNRRVSFLAQIPFNIGQSIILEVPSTDESATQRFQGHIRRSKQFSEGWFECVLELPASGK
jgi:hypothetical protein